MNITPTSDKIHHVFIYIGVLIVIIPHRLILINKYTFTTKTNCFKNLYFYTFVFKIIKPCVSFLIGRLLLLHLRGGEIPRPRYLHCGDFVTSEPGRKSFPIRPDACYNRRTFHLSLDAFSGNNKNIIIQIFDKHVLPTFERIHNSRLINKRKKY